MQIQPLKERTRVLGAMPGSAACHSRLRGTSGAGKALTPCEL